MLAGQRRSGPIVRRALFLAALVATAAAPAGAQQKPTLTPADYARWESLGTMELSPDGRWIAWVVNRVDQDEDLRYRRIDYDSVIIVPNGGRPTFSADGRWLAYSIGVSRAERERASSPPRWKMGLVDLRSGSTTILDDITNFDFSSDSRFLALRGYAQPSGSATGTDLLLRALETGTTTNFGNVSAYAWHHDAPLLAMVIDAEGRAGNGVRLYDARAGTLRTLVSDTAKFTGLVWRRDAGDLAVLRERNDPRFDEPTHVAHVWRNAATPSRTRFATLDPASHPAFPAAHRISDARELQFSEDGATLYLGIREWTPAHQPTSGDSAVAISSRDREPAGVEVWHPADVDIIPEQRVRQSLDAMRTMLSAWHLDLNSFVQLARDPLEEVTLSDGRMAVLLDGRTWEQERMFGPIYRNVYALDTRTGSRTQVAQRVEYQYGLSPSGRYILWVQDGHYHAYDAQTGQARNLTQGIATSFLNLENDFTIEEKPPYGTGGWASDGRTVLLYDRYDVWAVRADNGVARRLTDGAADRIRHRRMWLTPEHRIVDLSRPVYVSLYGERTKQFGYGRMLPNGRTETLVLEDRNFTRLGKAENADVFFFRAESFRESPNWYVAGPRLDNARRMSDTNPFQADYAWSRSELVDFRNAAGQELQAALHYPANYEPGRQYPMLVYFYEITSNQIHTYVPPDEASDYNPTVWTQEGYFVLRPDIVYRERDPGVSAVEALVPAVQRVLETGMVDRARVGIIGHSWGGYQTAFTVTQTDMFAAAVAGAPLTNLFSMYLSVYWNTGMTDARIFEINQGRMQVPFWEDLDAYKRNSPVFHIQTLDTPLLVAFGDKDGAVDFNQGVELYNAARRAGKNVVLLVYEGENHSLARRANRVDYHRRIREWFAHYLKGEPAAAWITDGVRHGDRLREVERIRAGG